MPKRLSPDHLANFKKLSKSYADATILMHEATARRIGITVTDYRYLELLIAKGEMTAGEIAASTGLTTGAVTGLIDRLEDKDLVRRDPDRSDRRKVVVVANYETVRNVIMPLFYEMWDKVDRLMASFSDEEVAVIERCIDRSVEILNETRTDIIQNRPKKLASAAGCED